MLQDQVCVPVCNGWFRSLCTIRKVFMKVRQATGHTCGNMAQLRPAHRVPLQVICQRALQCIQFLLNKDFDVIMIASMHIFRYNSFQLVHFKTLFGPFRPTVRLCYTYRDIYRKIKHTDPFVEFCDQPQLHLKVSASFFC